MSHPLTRLTAAAAALTAVSVAGAVVIDFPPLEEPDGTVNSEDYTVTGSAGAGGSANELFINLGGAVTTTAAGRLPASLGNQYEVIFDTFDYADGTPDGTLSVEFFDTVGTLVGSTDFVLDLPDNTFTSFEPGDFGPLAAPPTAASIGFSLDNAAGITFQNPQLSITVVPEPATAVAPAGLLALRRRGR